MKKLKLLGLVSVVMLLCGQAAVAQQDVTLKEAIQKAVLKNPEVQSRWHSFKASGEDVDAARGGLMPRVDLSAGRGREDLKQPGASDIDYTRSTFSLGLTQLVYDGFGTTSEVRRLGKVKLARYYELLDASENVALAAATAYYDVIRQRFLLSLSEDNYVYHKATYEQLLIRAQAGAGRRVDVEQAASRLALAEVNLITDQSNLHDVIARYLRIVGELPPATMYGAENLSGKMPATTNDAVRKAFKGNPGLLAAIEGVEVAQYALDVRRSAFHPRVELRARQDRTTNYLGSSDDRRDNVVEVVMNYNLFNGGSDMARTRQATELRHVALDQREQSCRDLRQIVSIAFNDTIRLKEQLAYLQQQVTLTERTREAYRDQFNIGQRTLLDVLDTENELFSARRAAVNADIDNSLAYMRTYAGMGQLLAVLELRRVDEGTQLDQEMAQVDPSELCPADAPVVAELDREALDRRAMEILAASNYAGKPGVEVVNSPEVQVQRQVNLWVTIRNHRDLPLYESFYAKTFRPENGSRDEWSRNLKAEFSRPASGDALMLKDLTVYSPSAGVVVAEFQESGSSTRRIQEWGMEGDRWVIQRETFVAPGRTNSR